MKALVLHEIKAPLQLTSRASLQPSEGTVVVDLRAAALNRRDYWITQGMYPGIKTPVVLGSDGAGTVREAGAGVDPAWLGRDVILDPGVDWGADPAAQSPEFTILGMPSDGTFATEVRVSVSQLHDKPTHLDWNTAAALPLAGVTAWRALFVQGEFEAGDRVLITGIGGGVAGFALQYAVAAGAEVWVTSSSQRKIEQAVAQGARGGFDYSEAEWWKDMLQQSGAPNVVIDSAGGAGFQSLVAVAAPGARIVSYGATTGPPEKIDLFKVFWKQLRIHGSTMGSPEDFANMLRFVSEKQLVPTVDSVFPLADGNEALQRMSTSSQFGKYVLALED